MWGFLCGYFVEEVLFVWCDVVRWWEGVIFIIWWGYLYEVVRCYRCDVMRILSMWREGVIYVMWWGCYLCDVRRVLSMWCGEGFIYWKWWRCYLCDVPRVLSKSWCYKHYLMRALSMWCDDAIYLMWWGYGRWILLPLEGYLQHIHSKCFDTL